jgi:4-hydroxy-tetrahydrodipicolinate synthase/2-dehydro-3-deoxy-phosphogluconate/2-dehydro-3-deoxy-6-phosphogalactonate aldolase
MTPFRAISKSLIFAELKVVLVIRGALAAAATPLTDGGTSLDEDAFAPMLELLADGGLDGVLALGTTGEGILLSAAERKKAAELVLDASGRLAVVVHCGAQTTVETVELAAHAAEAGANGVAVIAPPYYPLDEEALLAHFSAAARACEPLAFYVYEFAARSGYPVPVRVVERLREEASNLAGLKVSDRPFERVAPYLIDGLDVFVGAEPLVLEGLERGAAGAVSGLAAAFPEVVARLVHDRDAEADRTAASYRETIERFPFQAAIKACLAHRGVPIEEAVRPPLRTLRPAEREELERWLASS